MTVCANCDHLDICHEGAKCNRVMGANYLCPCQKYASAPDKPMVPDIGPEVMFGAGAQDLSPVFQDMIRRMVNPNKLTE